MKKLIERVVDHSLEALLVIVFLLFCLVLPACSTAPAPEAPRAAVQSVRSAPQCVTIKVVE